MRNQLLNIILKDIFKAITPDEVLQYKGGKFYVQGEALPDEMKSKLIAEAQTIKQTALWDYLIKDMQHVASKKLYNEAQSDDDMFFGKAMLFAVEVIRNKLDNLSKLK